MIQGMVLRVYISKCLLFQKNLDRLFSPILKIVKIAGFKDDVARDISEYLKKSHPFAAGIQRTRHRRGRGWLAYEHLVAFRAHVDAYQKGRREWIRYAGGAFNLIATPRPCEIPTGVRNYSRLSQHPSSFPRHLERSDASKV